MVENKLINGYEPALVRLYGARDSVEISEQMAACLLYTSDAADD